MKRCHINYKPILININYKKSFNFALKYSSNIDIKIQFTIIHQIENINNIHFNNH